MSDYFSCEPDPAAVAQIATRYGFCLVKNIFTQAETARLERDLGEAARAAGGDLLDLYSCPTLRWVMLDKRVTEIAKALLGDELVYYRQSHLAYEETPGAATLDPYRELHCDARGTPRSLLDGWNPSGSQIYGAYRFAVYFRNYRDFSGGLKVAVGSHRLPCEAFQLFNGAKAVNNLPAADHWFGDTILKIPVVPLELYNVASTPGDLVIFNLRCYHAAGAVRMADRPAFATLPLIEEGIRSTAPQLCLPIPQGCRNAIFFDYGAPAQEMDLYAKWRGLNSPGSGWSEPAFDPPSVPGVSLRNDKIIVALAKKVSATLDNAGGSRGALSPELRRDCQTLAELCRNYRAYSPYHPLFDAAAFERLCVGDFVEAGMRVAHEVEEKRTGLQRFEQKLRNQLG